MEVKPVLRKIRSELDAGTILIASGFAVVVGAVAIWGNGPATLSLDMRPAVDSCDPGYNPHSFITNQGRVLRAISSAEVQLVAESQSSASGNNRLLASYAISQLRTNGTSGEPVFDSEPADLFCTTKVGEVQKTALSPEGETTIGEIQGAGITVALPKNA